MKKLWQKMRSVGFVYIVGGLILSGSAALLLLAIASTASKYLFEDSLSKRLLLFISACIAAVGLVVLLEKRFVSRKF